MQELTLLSLDYVWLAGDDRDDIRILFWALEAYVLVCLFCCNKTLKAGYHQQVWLLTVLEAESVG